VLSQGPYIREEMMVETLDENGKVIVVDDPIIDDPIVDDPIVDDLELDDDGNPIVDDPKKLDWLGDDDQSTSDQMPVSAHIRAKRKLKGKIGDRDSEIQELRKEIDDLKRGRSIPPKDNTLVRPKEENFDSLEQFNDALDEYEDKRLDNKFSVAQTQRSINTKQTQAQEKLGRDVDAHYERASKLVKDSGISTESYRQADEVVRNAIEAIKPNLGDVIVDQIISLLGEGSEKVLYKLGVNKNLRGELIALLVEDPNGLKATAFLGEQKAKILHTTKRRSSAPAPASDINGGDVNVTGKERAHKKKYTDAHGKGNLQAAYNVKKAARAAGVDTSEW